MMSKKFFSIISIVMLINTGLGAMDLQEPTIDVRCAQGICVKLPERFVPYFQEIDGRNLQERDFKDIAPECVYELIKFLRLYEQHGASFDGYTQSDLDRLLAIAGQMDVGEAVRHFIGQLHDVLPFQEPYQVPEPSAPPVELVPEAMDQYIAMPLDQTSGQATAAQSIEQVYEPAGLPSAAPLYPSIETYSDAVTVAPGYINYDPPREIVLPATRAVSYGKPGLAIRIAHSMLRATTRVAYTTCRYQNAASSISRLCLYAMFGNTSSWRAGNLILNGVNLYRNPSLPNAVNTVVDGCYQLGLADRVGLSLKPFTDSWLYQIGWFSVYAVPRTYAMALELSGLYRELIPADHKKHHVTADRQYHDEDVRPAASQVSRWRSFTSCLSSSLKFIAPETHSRLREFKDNVIRLLSLRAFVGVPQNFNQHCLLTQLERGFNSLERYQVWKSALARGSFLIGNKAFESARAIESRYPAYYHDYGV